MEIKTYDTILNELCNDFDKSISPKRITRASTNILYLLLKAEAKGIEVLHNAFVSVSNKFNPEKCLDEDLESVAKLVGTRRLTGSATGLELTIKNKSDGDVTLVPGVYTYKLNDTDIFKFTQNLPEVITKDQLTVKKIAISTTLKPIPVTAQSNIKLEGLTAGGLVIDMTNFEVSCGDNAGLQGTTPETNLAFRERVVRGEAASDIFGKMREEIANLPYIFDCQLFFNKSTTSKMIDDVTIPPYHLLIVISGNPDDKVAEIVASYGTYETTAVSEESKVIKYKNEIFLDGEYIVNYIKPRNENYSLKIYYEADASAITSTTIEKKFNQALLKYKNTNIYTPVLTEREFSNYLMSLGLSTVQVLNVDLIDSKGMTKDYIKFTKLQLAQLENVSLVDVTKGE